MPARPTRSFAPATCCWGTVSSAGGAICISCPASSWMDCSPLITPARSAGGAKAEHGKNRRFVRSLGWYDQLVEYRKPQNRPKWMSKEQFKEAPQWILVREIRRQVWVGGVRQMVMLVTTLTDHR